MTDEEATMRARQILSDRACQIMVDVFLAALKPITDVFRRAYYNAGAPYGDSEEGFTRWLTELEQAIPDYRRRR